MTDYRVLVTGSRTWVDLDSVWRILDGLLLPERGTLSSGNEIVIVHGAANGADALAMQWADARRDDGWLVCDEPHPADWVSHGRKAGILRNLYMVGLGADLCLAFIRDNSRGATHCATTAHMAGIETRIERWA